MYHVPVFPKFKLDWRQVTAVLDIFIKARREKTSNFKQYVQKLFVLSLVQQQNNKNTVKVTITAPTRERFILGSTGSMNVEIKYSVNFGAATRYKIGNLGNCCALLVPSVEELLRVVF